MLSCEQDGMFYILLTARLDIIVQGKTNAQLILSIFHQPLHVSGVSRPIVVWYNSVYTKIVTYYSF